MSERWLQAFVVVVGVPTTLVGYITVVEGVLRLLPARRQPQVRPWLWVLPALLLLGVFLVYPALKTVSLSFMDARAEHWVGLDNYRRIFTERAFLIVLRNNALWLVFFTLLCTTIGLLIAVLADRVPYESAAKALIFMPMAISFVAAGVIWKFMYDYRPPGSPQTGTVNALLTATVPGFEPHAWLIDAPLNTFALIVAAVWVWTGFAMVVLSAALKGIPTELLEAARVDGATEWQVFRRIILPLLAPTLTVVATTLIITSLKAFDIVYVMTSGNFETDVIASRMYKEMFTVRHFGRASVLAVVLFTAIVPVMLINLRRFRAQEAIR